VRKDVQDVDEPNLMRDIYPYEEVPRIDFDHMMLPIDPAEEMFITDTTFRDGQQARPPYTVKQIETIFQLLHRLSGPNGVIRSPNSSSIPTRTARRSKPASPRVTPIRR